MTSNIEQNWARRTRLLTQILIISGALNIGLLTTFIYFSVQKKEQSIAFERPPSKTEGDLSKDSGNEHLLSLYSTLSFPELLTLLEETEPVAEGYKKRDLALACLTAFHFFNLEKAVATSSLQKRRLSFIHQEGQEKVDVTVFPGLSEEQYRAIIHYAKTEKWPYTPQGLFFEIQQAKAPRDPSLLEAFYLTPEFHTLSTLFLRSAVPLQKAGIVELAAQGDWRCLETFTQEQKLSQDLSPERLKGLLLTYLKKRSLLAAQILVAWDRDFVRMKLDDLDLILLLDLLVTKTPGLHALLKELLLSARSDLIWKKAAEKLYAFSGQVLPEPYDHTQTLQTFFPEALAAAPVLTPPQVAAKETAPESARSTKNKRRTYVVQEGDNLWKIARKHKTSVKSIIEQNHLESEKLRPGKELQIP